MEKINSGKIPTCIKLKLFNQKGELIHLSTLHRKSKIILVAQVHSWKEAYLKVVYDTPDDYNDGRYNSFSDFKEALKAFTEKDLIDYIKSTSPELNKGRIKGGFA